MSGTVSASGKNKTKLKIVLGLTSAYLIAEVIGGFVTGSLALLADAGHMLTDVGGLALAVTAIKFAERPATPERTYGFYRVEILAAMANALVLVGMSLYILYEAYKRFRQPPEVESGLMLGVAIVGLLVNIASALILRSGSEDSLNMKGAYFEVLSDMLTSIGVIIASLIMLTTGWYYADPLISAGIGLFIFPRTYVLLRDAVGVLLEGTPSGVNIADVQQGLESIEGVAGIHDLHVWSITSGVNAMSFHAVLTDETQFLTVLTRIHEHCVREFQISHLTVQVEPAGFVDHEAHINH